MDTSSLRILAGSLLLAAVPLHAGSPPPQCDGDPDSICINELLVEMPGKDAAREYVELRGPAAGAIPAGTWLVSVEGERNANPGQIDTVVDLGGLSFGASDGVSPHGFLVILAAGNSYGPLVNPSASTLASTSNGFAGLPDGRWLAGGDVNYQRPTSTYFLIQSAVAPAPGVDLDANDDGVPDTDPEVAWSVLDSIAAADQALDRTYGRINFRKAGTSAVGTTVVTPLRVGYFARFGDSFGSAAGAWLVSTQVGGTHPNWTLANTLPAGLSGKPLNHIGGINIWPNLAPVHALPAAPTALEDVALVLAGAGRIGIADADAGAGELATTVTASNGTLTLASTGGLVVTGDGSGLVTASGPLAALNAALDGLQFQPAADYFGPAGITIETNDQGNTGTSGPASDTDTLAFDVAPVNDAPSFVAGPDDTVEANTGARTVAPWATQLSAGPGNESGQTLQFTIIGNSNPAIFAVAPSVSPGGELSYTPAAVASGSATIQLTLGDSGGTANGGVDVSAPQSFTITVTPDVTLPTLAASAIDDGDADDSVFVADTLSYTVTFSEAMDGATIDASDFDNAGTADIGIGTAVVTGNVATVPVTANGPGTLVLRVAGDVRDLSGNALAVPVSDDTTVTVISRATATLITSDAPDPSLPGQGYTVQVDVDAESGTASGSVTVSDDQGASCVITLAAGSGSCQLASTVPGNRTLTADYAPDTPLHAPSSDTEAHAVHRPADLTVSKDNGEVFVERGEPLLYTIVVANAGTEALAGVRVQDALPAELVGAMWSCAPATGGTCPVPNAGTGDIDVLVDLAPGGQVVFTLIANVAANAPGGFLQNTASATAPAGYLELTPGDNSDTDIDEVYGVFRDGFEGP